MRFPSTKTTKALLTKIKKAFCLPSKGKKKERSPKNLSSDQADVNTGDRVIAHASSDETIHIRLGYPGLPYPRTFGLDRDPNSQASPHFNMVDHRTGELQLRPGTPLHEDSDGAEPESRHDNDTLPQLPSETPSFRRGCPTALSKEDIIRNEPADETHLPVMERIRIQNPDGTFTLNHRRIAQLQGQAKMAAQKKVLGDPPKSRVYPMEAWDCWPERTTPCHPTILTEAQREKIFKNRLEHQLKEIKAEEERRENPPKEQPCAPEPGLGFLEIETPQIHISQSPYVVLSADGYGFSFKRVSAEASSLSAILAREGKEHEKDGNNDEKDKNDGKNGTTPHDPSNNNDSDDLAFDVEDILFRDADAMERHYSNAENGKKKRVTVNPFWGEGEVEGMDGPQGSEAWNEGVDEDAMEIDEACELYSNREMDVWASGVGGKGTGVWDGSCFGSRFVGSRSGVPRWVVPKL